MLEKIELVDVPEYLIDIVIVNYQLTKPCVNKSFPDFFNRHIYRNAFYLLSGYKTLSHLNLVQRKCSFEKVGVQILFVFAEFFCLLEKIFNVGT